MEKTNQTAKALGTWGEMMLISPEKAALAEELTVLQDMLEVAVAGEGEENPPVPPAYGKTAIPMEDGRCDENIAKADTPLSLRQDKAISFGEKIIDLSTRKKGAYITVPQVVREGGTDA